MKTVEGAHNGPNIATIITSVINEFQIGSRLGYFVTGRATKNDTCIETLCEQFLPLTDPRHRRLRCLGHVINLVAKAFLFSNKTEASESAVKDLTLKTTDEKHFQELLKHWRQRGHVGKLHNMVSAIRVTPQRRQLFESCQGTATTKTKDLTVISDNIRIHRAIKLRWRLTGFCNRFHDEINVDWLTEEDWQQLDIIAEILEGFYPATKELEGNAEKGHHGSMWNYYPVLKRFFAHWKTQRQTIFLQLIRILLHPLILPEISLRITTS